ncbi:SrtB family sortase [Clostridia bacterium]|nr:SrtB family sortase [Clostridia bacterium]
MSSAYEPEATETPAPIITPTPKPTEIPKVENVPKIENIPKVSDVPKIEIITEIENVPEPTIRPEFTALMEQFNNQDIVGYLRIPNTSIDYPVLQSDDNEYYLHKNIYGQTIKSGSIFLDYENDILKDDYNMILYGHNMKERVMFHDLRNYQSKSYWENHRYITFNTLYEDMTWEIFSFYETHVSFYYYQAVFSDSAEFFKLAEKMKAKSMYDTGVTISPDDRVLTLSTCTNVHGDTRFVVNAKLVR